MPRPGPRPYECVRRAWHSDSHQPIRGSLIQEIFRVVHEIHSPGTKKNNEWQEKLPIVVLKAEDIMYSKANSEAEYMDLNTLWDRTNDAINTIIRLDENETTETGVFLQPCIEAALHLGCTPRRASRSQRNITPSYYLSPISPDKATITSSNLQNSVPGNHRTTNQFMSGYSEANKTSFSCLGMPSQSPAVYPLYLGDLQSKDSNFTFDTPSKSSFHSMKPSKICAKQDLYGKSVALNKPTEADIKDTIGNPYDNGCDLSLRLGCLGSPCEIIETSIDKELGNLGSRTPQGKMFIDSIIQIDNSFFKKSDICDSFDTRSTDLIIEAEKFNLKKTSRKRKAVLDHSSESNFFSWHSKLSFHDCTGRTRNAEP